MQSLFQIYTSFQTCFHPANNRLTVFVKALRNLMQDLSKRGNMFKQSSTDRSRGLCQDFSLFSMTKLFF